MFGKTPDRGSDPEYHGGIMARIISISNQKGGVGKTTTAVNLSACLAEKKKKVLLIDMDPQGNATSGVGADKDPDGIYNVLIGEKNINDAIRSTKIKRLDVLPGCVELAGVEVELIGIEDKEFILKKALDQIFTGYDYIIIDCPPSLSNLTVNALAASDSVLIPIQCEYYALEGVSQLMYTIHLIQTRLNPKLKVEGIVFTMCDMRTNLTLEVIANVSDYLDEHIFETKIPRNVRLAEAPGFGLPITYYDKKSTGAEAYKDLAKELIRKHKKK